MPITKNTILFFDNAKIHHSKIVINYLKEHRVKYIFNVSYCPEYNPIEFIFSKVKQNIKKYVNSTLSELKNNIISAYSTINNSDLNNSFNHSFNLLF